jgi:hypothetical protein
MQTTHQAKPTSAADSFFGMTLAMAFTGSVYGADMVQVYNASEAASEIYKDRFQKRADGTGNFQLGVKNSLGKAFAGIDQTFQTLGELDRASFRPSLAPRAFA